MKIWWEPILWVALLCFGGVASWAYWQPETVTVVDGDPARRRQLLSAFGCTACHTIPGVDGSNANVGPSLAKIGGLSYLAGRLPNTPDNVVLWITNPKGVDSETAMPQMGVSKPDAEDIASYLYTLR